VLEERNQRCSNRDELLRRHVHVVHASRLNVDKVTPATAIDAVRGEMTLVINRRIGLRHDELFLAIRREVIQVTGHATVLHFAIRRFEEAEIIDARKCRE
jgi:hypothetical protein